MCLGLKLTGLLVIGFMINSKMPEMVRASALLLIDSRLTRFPDRLPRGARGAGRSTSPGRYELRGLGWSL